MKIKVHGTGKDWGLIREAIFWMVFCILLGLASFEAGWIIRDFQKDETQKRVLKLETKFTDHDGRIVVLEGAPGRKK
jgi:hypothetical protein